jgi:hypothetical protein
LLGRLGRRGVGQQDVGLGVAEVASVHGRVNG